MVLRVCCIGAGPCGMNVLAAAKQFADQGEEVEISCYEKQRLPGGLWNYTWRTGTDEFGEPVHGSMYRDLFSNGPKECLEFPEYTFRDHFKKPIPSYPPRKILLDYLKGYWKHHGVKAEDITTTHVVRNVSYNPDLEEFTVRVENLETKESFEKVFDFVIVATGHFSVPIAPEFKGMDTYDGRVLHSHDFRNAREFIDQKVLIIGASYSGEDIALQLHKFGAAKITISYRTQPMEYKFPEEIQQHPLVDRIEEKTVYFIDGHSDEFDAIILCTGYQLKFPFLPSNLALNCGTVFNPPNLYRGVQWCDHEDTTRGRLFYLGMCDQSFTFTLFKMQAMWTVAYIKGLIEKKTTKEKHQDMDWFEKKLESCKHIVAKTAFQYLYIKAWAKDLNYTKNLDVLPQFLEWYNQKRKNVITYRNMTHRSNFEESDLTSPQLSKDWIEVKDDSMECFLNELCGEQASVKLTSGNGI